MWKNLIGSCDRQLAALGSKADIRSLGLMVRSLTPVVHDCRVTGEDLPYGRYLVHRDPQDQYNIQLDIFSKGYTGSIHCHGAWGMFWVLKGTLYSSDWGVRQNSFICFRENVIATGSAQSFCPPEPDWHRVGTPSEGPQTVSMHIYGAGYDLDQGVYLDDAFKAVKSKRSAFKPLDSIAPHLKTA